MRRYNTHFFAAIKFAIPLSYLVVRMSDQSRPQNFLQQIVSDDLSNEKVSKVVTRFPPEPNGFLHIGHAKSICLNFGLAQQFDGECHLRFDDTNPEKEDQRYVDAIKTDVEWLGYTWSGSVRYSSDYFDQLYAWALELIRARKAYVCELTQDEAREYRGTLTTPGRDSPYRNRPPTDSLELLEKMKAGDLDEGSAVLRAKIDMAHGNMNLRDPVMYRIRKIEHHQTGDKWNIYPSYDFGHGQGDAIEGITHSICTLEFADHRPLYDWFIENLPVPHAPKQYEFARLNVSYLVTSKRKLKQLVDEKVVDGWDDPRMPTLAGMRRAGITPRALRNFCEMVGVTKVDSLVDIGMLEYSIRDDLDKNAPRAMCVLRPLKVVLSNYPDGKHEEMHAPGHPNRDDLDARTIPFTREIFIEQEDFREEANKKYKRLVIGKRVRLRYGYVIEAENALKDAEGNVVEVHARIIENSVGRDPEDGVKPKGVIHWVSASRSEPCEVRLYDRLFAHQSPGSGGEDFMSQVNPNSLEVLTCSRVEPVMVDASTEQTYQFERQGYFCRDSKTESLVFNRTIGLRDTWVDS